MPPSLPVAVRAANDNVVVSPRYQRLMDALDKLNQALDGQAEAIAGFRESFSKLDDSVHRCQAGLERYRDNLDAIDVDTLHDRARTLAETADTWLTACEPKPENAG